MTEVYLLFDCCKIIRGYSRSMILDVQRKVFYFLPNDMLAFIDADGVVKEEAGSAPLMEFLLEEELAFKCDSNLAHQFIAPKSSTWNYPARISNAIVCSRGFDKEYLESIVHQLTEALQCKYIEFRFEAPLSPSEIEQVISYLSGLNLFTCSLCISLQNISADLQQLEQLLQNNRRLIKTIVFNYPKELAISNTTNYGNIFFTTAKSPALSCGLVSQKLFTLHQSHYNESLLHNTCLNRKIAIGADGSIKNCPGMAKGYGNIKDTALIDVVNDPEFQKLWHIKKDDIDKCRDCEFRHICTDCRAFRDDPANLYSAPLKCGYDPYTGQWEEWSTNPLKQSAIDYYGMNELVKHASKN